ncbi:hypothetical protein VS_2802 [Vibrio atlanticus]|uniref:Uncharacterized protein n=1 Tax=Vibrio atlanticus (strain LGP32) TaxID=575788 RepID=B7VKZ6_VIBA3|nr:hypothetical protein VS_2802 [Vibrio atlanticus]
MLSVVAERSILLVLWFLYCSYSMYRTQWHESSSKEKTESRPLSRVQGPTESGQRETKLDRSKENENLISANLGIIAEITPEIIDGDFADHINLIVCTATRA